MLRLDGRRAENQQVQWSRDAPPVAIVNPGDRFELRLPDSSTGQLTPTSTRDDLGRLDLSRVDAAVGPIAVRGARPGDALVIELLTIETAEWGWSGVFRDFGLLRGRFEDDLVVWVLNGKVARPRSGFLRPVDIPLRPMLGWIGVAPESGSHPMIPPRRTGGNMDNRLVAAGSTLRLPVEVDGANLLFGDPHASQGDGEVCGTGIETPARVLVRVGLDRGAAPPLPRLERWEAARPAYRLYAAMGIASDLGTACRLAVENLLGEMVDCGWTAPEAYVLASVAGNLRISEVVDEPNVVVTMTLPEALIRPPRAAERTPRRSRTRVRGRPGKP